MWGIMSGSDVARWPHGKQYPTPPRCADPLGQGDEESMRQLALSEEQLSMFRVYEETSGRKRLRR
jgi:hypothetical protein